MPPEASSLPERGRNLTDTSTSANFLSSRTATAQGCVSAVWARTPFRRSHFPSANFHFGLSFSKSSDTFSWAVTEILGVSAAGSLPLQARRRRHTVASALFIDPPLLRRLDPAIHLGPVDELGIDRDVIPLLDRKSVV